MPGDHVQIGSQIALRPRLPVERDGEAMRLVADPLHEQQRRALARQRDRVVAIAREEQLLFLRDARRRSSCPSPSSSSAAYAADSCPLPPSIRIRSGKRPAGLEHSPVAPQDDFVHGGEVVIHCARGSRLARSRRRGLETALARPQRCDIPSPVSEAAASRRPPDRRLRPEARGSGTSGTPPSASARLRTRPSTPRSRCPGSSRCRSTRCAAALPGSARTARSVSSAS